RQRVVALLVPALVLVSCGSAGGAEDRADAELSARTTPSPVPERTDTGPADATTVPDPPPPAAQLEGVRLTAAPIAEVEMLTAIAWREGDPDPYLADQHGQIYHLVGGRAEPVLDLTGEVLDYREGA